MSPKIPRVTAATVGRALERRGFVVVRQSGSHRIYRHPSGVRVTLPMHAAKILHPKILKTILDDAGIDPNEL